MAHKVEIHCSNLVTGPFLNEGDSQEKGLKMISADNAVDILCENPGKPVSHN